MKRFLAAAVALLMGTVLSGCNSTIFSADGAISPPVLTEEQSEIYSALRAQVADNIQLCYPLAGEYRSAFIRRNIDDEPKEEAIVFYRPALQGNRSTGVRINILDQTDDGKWVSACDVSAGGDEILQLEFSDFQNDEASDLIVGCYNSETGERNLTIYRYRDWMLKAEESRPYEVFTTLRSIGSGGSDGVVLVCQEESGSDLVAMAKTILWEDGAFKEKASYSLGTEVTEYYAIAFDKPDPDSVLIYLDGYDVENLLCTRILELSEDGEMRSLYDSYDQFRREPEIYCTDIDGDGRVEVPLGVENVREESDPDDERQYYIDWLTVGEDRYTVKETDYVNYPNGYRLVVPPQWRDTVGIRATSDQSDVTFYLPAEKEKGETELLQLRAVRSADLEKIPTREGLVRLTTVGQITYLAWINIETDSEYRMTRDELVRRFIVLM